MRRMLTPVAAIVAALLLTLSTAQPGGIPMANALTTTNFTFATNVNVSAGTNTFGGASGYSVPAGDLSVIFDTAGEASGIQFSLSVYATQDGGAAWTYLGGCDFTSDPGTDKQGNPTTTHEFATYYPGTGLRAVLTSSAHTKLSVSGQLITQ